MYIPLLLSLFSKEAAPDEYFLKIAFALLADSSLGSGLLKLDPTLSWANFLNKFADD